MNPKSPSRRKAILGLATLGLLAIGCAEMMNALEQATDPNSAEGKLIRGANRLRKSFNDLDPSEEHYIGRAVAATVLSDPNYKLTSDQALTDYVNRGGNAVAMSNDGVRQTFIGYTFAVLDSTEVNAFACPGGTILVTKGIVLQTKNEDELAAVLAHEIAHVTLRHGLAAIKQSNLTEAFVYLGEGAAQATLEGEDLKAVTGIFDNTVKDIVTGIFKNGYSRDAEREADQLGKNLLAATGYDPNALATILDRISHESGEGGLFSTHPGGPERVTDAKPAATAQPANPGDLAVRTARHHQFVRS